ncbi:I78 family peptidase inhibitor [Brevundimonas sp.]|uniref:I78 family peptidase inhibitor n=1 Tax=Brevundimonas sp. TaxID=1871086 RepID=UPI002D6B7FD7|nr:I78 family peptidase inhibitor [Brevundimonas sp.]HYC68066.1 I78 family peptidase inhibitor [Brevundimonas sp.]
MKIQLLSLAAAGLLAAACAPMEDEAAPTPPEDGPSQCKADQYQRFIGRNRSELPAKPAGETWRVTCTTCPVTMDYSPSRLNIFYEQATGIIREVKCG